MTASRIALIFVTIATLTVACGPSFEHVTPPGFVKLEPREPYDYRAVNAEGLVLAAREIEHDPKGDLAFWTEAIANQLRQRGGYALLGKRPVKTGAGLAGTQLRFGHDEGARPYLYYVTVLVTDESIYLLEAGGSKEQMQKHAGAIAAAIEGFRAE